MTLPPSRRRRDIGLDLTPDHEALNIAMAVSLVASTGGVSLLPLYVRNMLPPSVVSRPIDGVAPTIDLALGFNEANSSPLLKSLLSRIDDLKFRVHGVAQSAREPGR